MPRSDVIRCRHCGQRMRRSTPQNSRLWLLYHMAAERLKPGGESYTAEQYHLYYKSRLLGCVDHRLPNGAVVTIPNSTADLDVAEFNTFMEQVEADLAERGVYLHEVFEP